MINEVTPCIKNNHSPTKIVKSVADVVKDVPLKETITASEVFSNKHNEEECDLQGFDENGFGINFEVDEGDKGVDCNDYNVNKPSLKDYPLSQYITTQPSVASLTQLSETSLSNVKTNLDFDAMTAMSPKIKRTLIDNFPTNKRLKKALFLKLIQKHFPSHMVPFVDHIKFQKLISNCRLNHYLPLLLTVVRQNLVLKDNLMISK